MKRTVEIDTSIDMVADENTLVEITHDVGDPTKLKLYVHTSEGTIVRIGKLGEHQIVLDSAVGKFIPAPKGK